MTAKQAIKWIKQIQIVGYEERLLNHKEALDTGIKALQQISEIKKMINSFLNIEEDVRVGGLKMPVIDCDRYSCLYNDSGFCEADMINIINTNCETYEDNSYEMMDDIEREEYMQEATE